MPRKIGTGDEIKKRRRRVGGWIFLGGPSRRGSSSGTIIMVFLCIFALHTRYISFLVIPTLLVGLYYFDVYWFMRRDDIEQAFRIEDEMVACGIEANLIMWNTLLNGVCKAGKMEKALEIMREMMEKGVELDSQTHSLLVEEYCREQNMARACELRDEMKKRKLALTVLTYSVLIHGLSRNELLRYFGCFMPTQWH